MIIKEMLSYYNLEKPPFTKEIKTADLQRLPTTEKAINSARLLVETKGIGVMTGKSGTGKSCILRMLKNDLNPGLYKVMYLWHTSIGILEFYTHLCAELGLEPRLRRAVMFRMIHERILSLNKSHHIHPVLLIDEAHLLNNDILKEIRLLTNFEIDSVNALTVLLCGQENLNMKFGLSTLEPLANSITVNIHVESLKKEESFSYIEQRVSCAGSSTALFTKNAITFIHEASGGIIRNINTIANGSLFKAFYSKSSQVEAEHVKAVIQR
ncbi:MAG: AAA family ATPase [Spirochaetales bacterium]|nr:AAA family ATPase [Spirochaetales bacterium]